MRDRCAEEIELLQLECGWTRVFFQNKAVALLDQAESATARGCAGPAAYWQRQATLYNRLAEASHECADYMGSQPISS